MPFLTNLLKFGEGAARGYENAHLRRVAEEKDKSILEFEQTLKKAMLGLEEKKVANDTRRTDTDITTTLNEDKRKEGAFQNDYGTKPGSKPIGINVGGNNLQLDNNVANLERLLGFFGNQENNRSRERISREDNKFRLEHPGAFNGGDSGELTPKDKASLLMKFITDNNTASMSMGTDQAEASRLSTRNWRNAHKMAPDLIPEHPADTAWKGIEGASTREEAESQWSSFQLNHPDIADEIDPDALKQLFESKPSTGPARDMGPKKKKEQGGKFQGSGPRSGTDLF